MFTRKHLPKLEEAIQMLVTNEEDKTEKHGQKLFIDAIILRLTLYNARRGEDAARLTLKEYEEAVDGSWLPEELEKIKDPAEEYLVDQFKLAYRKGNFITHI